METIKALTGKNKTGMARVQERADEMLRSNQEFASTAISDGHLLADVRKQYAGEDEPIGTLPAPASMQQLGKTAVAAIKAGHPTVLIDKLAARLAFERSGVRLYEAMLAKFDAKGGVEDGPSHADLALLREQELEHCAVVLHAIQHLGADPTVMTPSADVEATAARGLQEVVTDPRTSFTQALEAILIAELTDNEMWDTLVELAAGVGEEGLVARFSQARDQEREHLVKLRAWMAAARAAA